MLTFFETTEPNLCLCTYSTPEELSFLCWSPRSREAFWDIRFHWLIRCILPQQVGYRVEVDLLGRFHAFYMLKLIAKMLLHRVHGGACTRSV
jgi:hypothetical protein